MQKQVWGRGGRERSKVEHKRGQFCSVENLAFVAEFVRIRFDGLPNSHEFGYEELRRTKVFYRAGQFRFSRNCPLLLLICSTNTTRLLNVT
jgi:hypothetical protein